MSPNETVNKSTSIRVDIGKSSIANLSDKSNYEYECVSISSNESSKYDRVHECQRVCEFTDESEWK